MLRDHHRQTEIVNQSLQRGEDVLGTLRIQLARWFVQEQDSCPGSEGRGDRDPLTLASR